MRILACLIGAVAALSMALPANGQTVLFMDTFDRPDSTVDTTGGFQSFFATPFTGTGINLTESFAGQSGTIGGATITGSTVNFANQVGADPDFFGNLGSDIGILSNQLVIEAGDSNGASGGFALINHNFIDPEILAAGEFTVSLDIFDASSAGSTRRLGFGVGTTPGDLSGFSSADLSTQDVADVFVTFDNAAVGTIDDADFGIDIFEGAVQTLDNGDPGAGTQDDVNGEAFADDPGPVNLSVRYFNITDFNAGSTFDFEVTLDDFDTTDGGPLVITGDGAFSGTDENYIVISAGFTEGVIVDNFSVTTLDTDTAAVPEPSSVVLLAIGGMGVMVRRRKQSIND